MLTPFHEGTKNANIANSKLCLILFFELVVVVSIRTSFVRTLTLRTSHELSRKESLIRKNIKVGEGEGEVSNIFGVFEYLISSQKGKIKKSGL